MGEFGKMKLTEAGSRVLLYMQETGCRIRLGDWSTGWTEDRFRWPVAGVTLINLRDWGFLARDPSSNHAEYLMLTDAGRAAIAKAEATR